MTRLLLLPYREFCTPTMPYKPTDIEEVEIVRKRGIDLLHDPLYNKVGAAATAVTWTCLFGALPSSFDEPRAQQGVPACNEQHNLYMVSDACHASPAQGTAFPASERERLELRGLLPKKELTLEFQVGAASATAPLNECFLALFPSMVPSHD